jgi:hypothetical protein
MDDRQLSRKEFEAALFSGEEWKDISERWRAFSDRLCTEIQRLRPDLEAERNRNRSLWEENKRLTYALKESQAAAELAVRRVTEENERLRDAITGARHADDCGHWKNICSVCHESHNHDLPYPPKPNCPEPFEWLDGPCNCFKRAIFGSPEPAPHVENATGKPKVACIKCGDTGWLTGPGHDGEACECNQIKAV